MRVVVPYDAREPKTRLAPALDADERAEFARAMLEDVVATLAAAGAEPEVLSTAPVDPSPGVVDPDRVTVTVDERPLTPAVNDVLAESLGDPGGDGTVPRPHPPTPAEAEDEESEPVAVVMADLALATPDAVEELLAASGDVVLVPGRGGGTNALVARHPGFRVDYHGVSFRDHQGIAESVAALVEVVDSYRLSTDVDEPEDLAEVLLHGRPRSRQWLLDHGFGVATDDEDRVGVVRDGVPVDGA